jgi:glutamine synthetase
MITIEQLAELHNANEIDTVLVVFPDVQGRFMGKRVLSSFFLSEIPTSGGAVEACNYLLAVDVDMNVLEGFASANWESGYGDFVCVPDLSTLHVVPWLEKTALVICDLVNHDGSPVTVAPRSILQAQIARAAEQNMKVKAGTELEFFLFEQSMEQAWDQDFKNLTPSSRYIIDYHILHTSKDEWLIRKIRNDMAAAGLPVEFSKGEAGLGQHELNLRYDDVLAMADNHTIYKNGAKEIAALAGRALTFMAKYKFDEVGSSCHIHSSVWDATTNRSLMASAEDPHELSDTFRWWLGGLLATAADFAICWAPYINSYKRYQPGSWAPTAIGWGMDNRTLGFRVVGHGQGMRVESRIPGADANPYIALAATIAGGLYGIENKIEPADAFVGNGYESDLDRIPHTLVDAISKFEHSEIAKAAFGEEAHFHLLHMARQEWAEFNRYVTDWELRRNFERL